MPYSNSNLLRVAVAVLLILGIAAPASAQISGQSEAVESTYVPQYTPFPTGAIRDAADSIQRRVDKNSKLLSHLLEWVYETKPAVSDSTLLQDLNDYQSLLENMQKRALSDAGPRLRRIESGLKKAVSNARIRKRGGNPDNDLPLLSGIRYMRTLFAQRRATSRNDFLLLDKFKDASQGWQTEAVEGEEISLADGNYVMKVTAERRWHQFTVPASGLSTLDDYVVEAKMRRVAHEKTETPLFGVIWGMKDTRNYSAFLINPANRSFLVLRSIAGNTVKLAEGKNADGIRSGSSNNLIQVNRMGGKYTFMINGTPVAQTEAESISGDKVGFFVGPKQTVMASSILAIRLSQE